MTSKEPSFSVRIVSVDYYVSVGVIKDLDVCYSNFSGSGIKNVPIIRIFGSTPCGQKTCVHIHKVFPYFFVPYDNALPLDFESGKRDLLEISF
jgi:DNA polymerase zeta